MMQQSLARLLGLLDYNSYSHALPEAIDCIVTSVMPSVKPPTMLAAIATDSDGFFKSELRMPDVDARRLCIVSIRLILTALTPQPSRRM